MFEIISKLFTLTTIVTNQCFLGWGREEVEEGGKGGEGGVDTKPTLKINF